MQAEPQSFILKGAVKLNGGGRGSCPRGKTTRPRIEEGLGGRSVPFRAFFQAISRNILEKPLKDAIVIHRRAADVHVEIVSQFQHRAEAVM